jgi:hypothetical protein
MIVILLTIAAARALVARIGIAAHKESAAGVIIVLVLKTVIVANLGDGIAEHGTVRVAVMTQAVTPGQTKDVVLLAAVLLIKCIKPEPVVRPPVPQQADVWLIVCAEAHPVYQR